MAMTEEIARLTSSVVFKADLKPLIAFEKRLSALDGKLRAFSELANKRFNIKVQLDARTLRAQLDRAANAKIVFKHFGADLVALDALQARIKDKFDTTRINLKNIRINTSQVLAERASLRKQIEAITVHAKVGLGFQEANASLREWKASTEKRFKLHLNADISRSKLYRNAKATLELVAARLGTITLKTPKLRLSVDRQHLRAEIASVLEQIKREVRIKIDLNSSVHGNGSAGGSRMRGTGRAAAGGALAGGLMGEGMGLARGFVPGLGAAYAIGSMNRINQELVAADTALSAVSGDDYDSNRKFLENLTREQGRNMRDMSPQFNSVLASAKDSIGSQGTQDLFRGMAKYGTVMGLDGEAMKGSFRAISQMFSKDKIQAEEAQGQLAERLPAAMQLLAKANGTDVPGLREQMQKGALDPKKVLPQMARIMEDLAEANGAYAKALDTTRVQQGRMNREFEDAVKIFANGGFDAGLKSFFREMAEGMQRAEPLIKALGAAFEVLIQPINALIRIVSHIGQHFEGLANSIGVTKKQLALLPLLLFPVITSLGLLFLAIDDIMTFQRGGKSLFGDWLKDTPEAQKAFDDMKDSLQSLKNTWNELVNGESNDGFKTLVENLKTNFASINFSDMFIQTMRELKMIMDLVNSTIVRLTSANEYSKIVSGEGAGELTQSMNFIKGLTMNPAEQQEDLKRQRLGPYGLPQFPTAVTADEIKEEADRKQRIRAPLTLPGINTSLAGGEQGEIPVNQQGGLLAPQSKTEINMGGVQIVIKNDDDNTLATRVRQELEKTFKAYQPKEVK